MILLELIIKHGKTIGGSDGGQNVKHDVMTIYPIRGLFRKQAKKIMT